LKITFKLSSAATKTATEPKKVAVFPILTSNESKKSAGKAALSGSKAIPSRVMQSKVAKIPSKTL